MQVYISEPYLHRNKVQTKLFLCYVDLNLSKVIFMSSQIKKVLLGCLLWINHAAASDVALLGTTERLIDVRHETSLSVGANASQKKIILSEYLLSGHARQKLYQGMLKRLAYDGGRRDFDQTKQVQLGMNNVPVLDQGLHGTCTIFAMTAALDAALNKGHYISQLCLLELGNQLQLDGAKHSGWEGLSLEESLYRVAQYGVINRDFQRRGSCTGVRFYPSYWMASSSPMPVEAYLERSEKIFGRAVSWRLLFDKFPGEALYQTTDAIKAAIDAGHRVVFGVLLPQSDVGTAGAVGWHHWFQDTWVLTDAMLREVRENSHISGHAMIVTGYDDTAKAMDNDGYTHQGLFTVRNSWGRSVGDWGDFYMSYDYFDALAMEGYEIESM
jgi:hypothetical protein